MPRIPHECTLARSVQCTVCTVYTVTSSLRALKLQLYEWEYLPHRCPGKDLKGTVVNRTCLFINGRSLEITPPVSLKPLSGYRQKGNSDQRKNLKVIDYKTTWIQTCKGLKGFCWQIRIYSLILDQRFEGYRCASDMFSNDRTLKISFISSNFGPRL